jgi:hypothetical protein
LCHGILPKKLYKNIEDLHFKNEEELIMTLTRPTEPVKLAPQVQRLKRCIANNAPNNARFSERTHIAFTTCSKETKEAFKYGQALAVLGGILK